MNGMIKDNFLYLIVPKNGCMTYMTFLAKHGWEEIDLSLALQNDMDLSKLKIWAHITDPEVRHTKGVEQYLRLNPDINIDDEQVSKLLVSGVFDEHTFSLHMLFPSIIGFYPIHWIPLDYDGDGQYKSGDDLTNWFFSESGLPLTISITDRCNVSLPHNKMIQARISDLKSIYRENYHKIQHNFLGQDTLLYYKVLMDYKMKLALL